jgi:hypothetical protein
MAGRAVAHCAVVEYNVALTPVSFFSSQQGQRDRRRRQRRPAAAALLLSKP